MVGSGYVVKLGDFGMARAMYDSDYYRFGRKGKANILPCSYFLLGATCWTMGLAGGWLAAGKEGGCGATGPLGLTGTCGTGGAEPADGVGNYQDRSKSCSNYSIALRTVRNCSVFCAEVITLCF